MGFTAVKNTVCVSCLNFVLPLSILNLWWSVNWLHILYDKCTRRNCSELTHCPEVQDQWDCVLNDLEELGHKEFLVLTSQYNFEIFSCCLRLLASCSSTFHQTIIGSPQIRSEDHLLISRIQSLHLLFEVDDHVEEEYSVVLTLGKRWTNNFSGSISVQEFSRISTVLVHEQATVRLRSFALVFDRLAKASTFVFNANSSDFISEVSCSLSSCSLLFKVVTNLFKPWEILTHEWELSLFTDSILISTPY